METFLSLHSSPTWALQGEPGPSQVAERKYSTVASAHDAWPSGWPTTWRDPARDPGRVWRADVFDVASSWRAGETPTRQLLGAVCAWGHGLRGYGPWRTGKTLAAIDLDRRLDALNPLRSETIATEALIEAYQAFRHPNRDCPSSAHHFSRSCSTSLATAETGILCSLSSSTPSSHGVSRTTSACAGRTASMFRGGRRWSGRPT